MKKIIFILFFTSIYILCTYGRDNCYPNTQIFIFTDDPFNEQYIIFRNDNTCKLIVNFCQGFAEVEDKYHINDEVITFENHRLKLALNQKGANMLHIIDATDFTCGGGEKEAILDNLKVEYYSPTVEKLRLRYYSSSRYPEKGDFKRFLDINEKIIVIRKLKQQVINGITGDWVLVETSKRERGVCFDGYLKKLK